MENIVIQQLNQDHISQKTFDDLKTLVSHMTDRAYPLSIDNLHEIATIKNMTIFLAYVEEHIVGMVACIIAPLLDKKTMFLENMVVLEEMRGKGIGKQLTQSAIDLAREQHVTEIDLTSNPQRIAAIGLYESLGFKKYDTNVYRLKL